MRKFLGIYCHHCNFYFRIYLEDNGRTYRGHCPKCQRKVSAYIDPKRGIKQRFFVGR